MLINTLLLLLAVTGSSAFILSCQDVDALTSLEFTGTTVCAVTEEGEVSHATDNFVLQEIGTDKQITVSDLATSKTNCIDGTTGEWRLLPYRGSDACTLHFTLIFTRDPITVYPVREVEHQYVIPPRQRYAFVRPAGGFYLNGIQYGGDVTFYTGAGGKRDLMFAYKTKLSEDCPLTGYIALEAVMSIEADDQHVVLRVTSNYTRPHVEGRSQMVVLSSSNLANDIRNFTSSHKTINFDLSTSGFFSMANTLTEGYFGSRSYMSIDSSYDAGKLHDSIKITEKGEEFSRPIKTTNLQITYHTDETANVWNDEKVFYEMCFTEGHEPPVAQNYCTCDEKQLWLDVVFVVDSSAAMTASGLASVEYTIKSLLYGPTLGADRHETRVAIVQYSAQVVVPYDLMSIQSLMDVQRISLPFLDGSGANITGGLNAAMDLLKKQAMGTRQQTREVIVVIASSYDEKNDASVRQVADEFKEDQGLIITVEFIQSHEVNIPGLSAIASVGYALSTKTNDESLKFSTTSVLKAFCDANCFCPTGLNNYVFNSTRNLPSGGCYDYVTISAVYAMADLNCKGKKGVVSTLHNADKQMYLMTLMNADNKDPYWIGYQAEGSTWKWADGLPQGYENWATNQPDMSASCAYSVKTSGFTSAWSTAQCTSPMSAFKYACEIRPCDSTYYCF